MSGYSYLFYPRSDRANSEETTFGSPEQGPSASLQAVVNTAKISNQKDVRLGPYEYILKSTLEIPEGVSVSGVHSQTKIRIVWTEANPYYGPVVTLAERSSIRDCYIDLTLGSSGGFDRDSGRFIAPDTSVTALDTTNNCVVRMNGEWSRMENCEIPAGTRRGVLVTSNRAMVIGNTISNDTVNSNAAVYVNDGYYGCVIANNACYTYPGVISVQNVVDPAASNVVTGNFATLVER